MKASLAPMLFWWEARAPRERLLLLTMMVVIGIWLAVVAIWQPLQGARARLGDRIVRHENALAILRSQPVAAAPVTAPDDRPLNVVITETAAEYGMTIRRLEPDGPRISVVLDEALFDSVIFWLEALQRDHGLTVTELELTRRPAPGVVNVSLALER